MTCPPSRLEAAEARVAELEIEASLLHFLRAAALTVYRKHDDEVQSDEWDLFESALFAALQHEVTKKLFEETVNV